MRFLHINKADIVGGAAISMYRLHEAFRKSGHGSRILCGRKYSSDPDVAPIIPGRWGHRVGQAFGWGVNALGLQAQYNPSALWLRASRHIPWADVVILKNLHDDYFSMSALPWLARQKPLVWRLADMWPLTGHCAYSYACERWETGCRPCPSLKEYAPLPFDTAGLLWKRKQRIFEQLKGRLVIVSPSAWLAGIVGRSPLLKDFPICQVPTAVDLDLFSPADQGSSRDRLGIRRDRKVVMLSGVQLKDPRKGGEMIRQLIGAVDGPGSRKDIVWMILGHASDEVRKMFPTESQVVFPGFIGNDRELVPYYRAADIYVSLSRADNLPNTLIEAAACGIPAVTLDNGGCGEAVIHERTGFVVQDIAGAVEALHRLLGDSSLRASCARQARDLAEKRFSMTDQVEAYVRIGEQMLQPGKARV